MKLAAWLRQKFTVKPQKQKSLFKRHTWRDFFEVSRQEFISVVWLLILLFALIIILYVVKYRWPVTGFTDEEAKAFYNKASAALALKDSVPVNYNQEKPEQSFYSEEFENKKPSAERLSIEYFEFDPNLATEEDFEKLGLGQRQIKSIVNYRNKGGRFYDKESFRKIYNLSEKDYLRLEKYINIPATAFAENKSENFSKQSGKRIPIVDIAFADTLALQELPGIGSGYAKRITTYRYKLGGFARVEQLAEVWNMPDSVYQRILPYVILKDTNIRTININVAEYKDLRKHPYFSEDLARVLVSYRSMHGSFKNLEDIKKVALVTSDFIQKIKPYLRFE